MTVHDLFVGKHGVTTRAPVDGCLFAVSQSVLVQLAENPLRPLVVVGQAGLYFVVPVKHCADVFQLFFHYGDVVQSAVLGVYARLDGVVFRRQAERVETHGLKHVFAFHYLVACKTVGKTVIVPVTDVQLCAAGVTEHFQHVVLVGNVLFVKLVHLVFVPEFVPFFFNGYLVHINLSTERSTMLP